MLIQYISVPRAEVISFHFKTSSIKKLVHKRAHKNEEAEFLYERIRMLENESQSLKSEIKNQQAVIEMLIKK